MSDGGPKSGGDALVFRLSRPKAAPHVVGVLAVALFFAGMAFNADDLGWFMRAVVACLAIGFAAASVPMVRNLMAAGPALVVDDRGLTDHQSGVGPIPLDRIVAMEGRRRRLKIAFQAPDAPSGAKPTGLTIDVGVLDRPPREVFALIEKATRTRL